MKKLVFALLLCSIIVGCKEEPKTSYVIDGTAEGIYNGIRIYLNKMDDRRRLTPLDTAIVMNERFSFNGSVKYPQLLYLTLNGTSGRLPLIIENGDGELILDKKILINSKYLGSKSHSIYDNFQKKMNQLTKDFTKAKENLSQSQFLNDTANIEYDSNVLTKLTDKINEFQYSYISENNESYGVLPLLNTLIYTRGVNYDRIITLYEGLDEKIKKSPEGININTTLTNIKQRLEAEKVTALGAKAPEFSGPNPKGETIALKDVTSKGKVTIIDFWAAWCGPCRRENPNVVRVYEKYHDKGLEIIGVGLDGRRGQQKPKEAWIKAIKDDNLTWHQVSNLRYFDEIAKLYNVNSIPSMLILDNEGRIIAKNLRGPALERKVVELLK